MKRKLYKTLVAFGMLFTFVISIWGNSMEVRADEAPAGMKIAKAIYDGTWLKVTLKGALEETRKILAKTYTIDELYEIMLSSGPESVVRRQKTKQLEQCFRERIQSWKK